jgi:hypothetical protein
VPEGSLTACDEEQAVGAFGEPAGPAPMAGAGAAGTPASHPPRDEWWSGPRRALQPRAALAQEIAALVREGSVSVSVRDEKQAEAPAGRLPRDEFGTDGIHYSADVKQTVVLRRMPREFGTGRIHHAADVKQTEVLRRIRQEEPTR